jgi:radical SAM superfamily enzyme YgiQ (UPF0313 family)
MKVCLIYPRLKYISGDPPLGLAYIAAHIRRMAIVDVSILDTTFNPSFEYVKSFLIKQKPDIVGIYFDTIMFNDGLKIAKIAKKLGIFVITGGPHATVMPETLINNVDAVAIGEGEEIVKNLIENFPDLRKVKGIIYKENGKICKNPPQPRIANLDNLEFPARDLLEMEKYIYNWHFLDSVDINLRGTNIIASRGCPFNCSFCQPTLRTLFGDVVRKRSPENVIKEIKRIVNQYNLDGIFFHDDTFTINRDWIINFCNLLKKENLGILWGCNSRVNTIDKELMKIMYNAGLRELHIGIESGSQRILDEIYQKGIKLEDAKKVIKTAKEIGINTLCFFMIGAPTETEEEVWKTINFASSLDSDEITFSITTPLPKTRLYDFVKENYTISKNFSDFDYYSKRAFYDVNLDNDKLKRLRSIALFKFYTNPKHWRYTLKHVTSIKGTRKMIMKLKRFV